jgi:microcystin-dependent protein
MAPLPTNTTPNNSLNLPTIGGDTNEWGALLNANFTKIDQFLVPKGVILLWSGAVDDLPDGWALCDGQNNTPDLRNRFLVGAGGDYEPDDTGGSNTVLLTEAQVPAHAHTVDLQTAAAGGHTHTATVTPAGAHSHRPEGNAGNFFRQGAGGPISGIQNGNSFVGGITTHGQTAPVADHSHAVALEPASNHAHAVTGQTDSYGGGVAHENRPPYYALAYIMKL